MLPSALLNDYVEKFYGFGAWSAKIWFIGIEEAGGRNVQEVRRRLEVWKEAGSRDLEDAPRFYPACGNERWHGKNAVSQPTWRQLIRMVLLARGQDATDSGILEYQRTDWGAAKGSSCLTELLPLPCPSTADWPYADWSSLPWLKSRKEYMAKVRPMRENELRRRVTEHKPKVVIFYGLKLPDGTSLLRSWESIALGRFEQAFPDEKILLRRKTPDTAFYVTWHPVAEVVESDEYFTKIGALLRASEFVNRIKQRG